MIDALIWGVAFVLMSLGFGGGAVLCVHMVESGKNIRMIEAEKTKRRGMDNAWQLEQAKLDGRALVSGAHMPNELREISFDITGGDDSWK